MRPSYTYPAWLYSHIIPSCGVVSCFRHSLCFGSNKLVSINEKSWDIKNVVFIEEGGIIHALQVVDNDLRPLAIGSDKTIDSDAIQTTKFPLVHHKPFFSSLSLIVVHALCRCDFN